MSSPCPPHAENPSAAGSLANDLHKSQLSQLGHSADFGSTDNLSLLASPAVVSRLRVRELGEVRGPLKVTIGKSFIPSGGGEILEVYEARAYSGQFSEDGSIFYSCTQDYLLHVYDTTDTGHFRKRRSIQCQEGRWTITDASLSPNKRWLCYSSITPMVWLVDLGGLMDADEDTALEQTTEQDGNSHVPLDFLQSTRTADPNSHFGLWSLKFSGDGREIVAGASDAHIYVYDIERRKVVHRIPGHQEDVNAVCFADAESSHILFSGSDDTFLKVWDRRSMGRNRGCPSGVLAGHTEGITHVASKGDGRYCLSNGKDQQMKLWDIRFLYSSSQFDAMDGKLEYRQDWDYRFMDYPGNPSFRHPRDVSVGTFVGHKVLKTLIRCGFSPPTITGQAYVYSGSEDGRVHIYNIQGDVVRILDVSQSTRGKQSFHAAFSGTAYDGDAWLYTYMWRRHGGRQKPVVRDVSWHPYEPVIVSTTWGGKHGTAGAIVRHEYSPISNNQV